MAGNEILVLSDNQIIPTNELIFSIIGRKKIFWQAIMKYLTDNHKDISGNWNYYNDGKQWLFKMVQKKKTIFWAALLENTFRITFWFGDKAEPLLAESDLPLQIKENFRAAKKYGSIRAVSIIVENETDVDNVLKLVNIKKKIK
jgi:hypothetical protein